jgi:hypothetical protein
MASQGSKFTYAFFIVSASHCTSQSGLLAQLVAGFRSLLNLSGSFFRQWVSVVRLMMLNLSILWPILQWEMGTTQRWQWILTNLTREQFERFVLLPRSIGSRGPAPKLPAYPIFDISGAKPGKRKGCAAEILRDCAQRKSSIRGLAP